MENKIESTVNDLDRYSSEVQSTYFIYTRLIVCAILNLAYPKEYVLSNTI